MFAVEHTRATVLCCLCGTCIEANPANMCVNCLRSQVDVTEGIQKQVTVLYCKECGRYLQPPRHWVKCELESKELLTFCIKKLKGLNKVKLVDAGFIWTEPHSKRLKVKLTIQKEVLNGTILQQTFVAEYVVEWHMCDACAKMAANSDQWVACCQVRQHVDHKRSFFLLEQLILKHSAHTNTVSVKNAPDGVDFFFGNRSHALKFNDFLSSVVPIKTRNDKQLVSHDEHAGTYNYKFTFSVKLVPLCKEDLCLLPHKVSHALGGMGPVVLCTSVTSAVHMLDPMTLRQVHVDSNAYWRAPYTAMLSFKQLVEYVVLDTELLGPTLGRWALADVQVVRSSDFGKNDTTYFTRTHLGNLLQPGDIALGYDVASANIVDPELDKYRGLQLPDVILVRKSYAEKRRKKRQKGQQRPWTLRRMDVVEQEAQNKKQAAMHASHEAERERFLEEIEEDDELRARVNIYRDPRVQIPAAGGGSAREPTMDAESDDDGEEVPEVPLEELLNALTIDQARDPAQEEEDDDESDEAMED